MVETVSTARSILIDASLPIGPLIFGAAPSASTLSLPFTLTENASVNWRPFSDRVTNIPALATAQSISETEVLRIHIVMGDFDIGSPPFRRD
jgi:hypothetical protein